MSSYQYTKPTQTDNSHSPQKIIQRDGTTISTAFVFKNVACQNAANTLYQAQQAANTANNASVTGNTFKFASDQDRLAALMGKYNQAPCTNN